MAKRLQDFGCRKLTKVESLQFLNISTSMLFGKYVVFPKKKTNRTSRSWPRDLKASARPSGLNIFNGQWNAVPRTAIRKAPNLIIFSWRSAASCSAIFLSRPINRSASSLGRRDETCANWSHWLRDLPIQRCTKQEALKTEVSLQLCPNQKRWTDKSAKYHQGLAAGHVFPHTCSVLSSSSTLHLASPDMPKHQQLQNASAWSQRASRMPYNAYWVCITGHCNGKALVGTWYQHAYGILGIYSIRMYTVHAVNLCKSDLAGKKKKTMCISAPRLSTSCSLSVSAWVEWSSASGPCHPHHPQPTWHGRTAHGYRSDYS